jgi:hypothetical protein
MAMDTRPLETTRRRMDGSAGEWGALAPVPDAAAVAWGVIEACRELLRVWQADAAVLSVLDTAIASLEGGTVAVRGAPKAARG